MFLTNEGAVLALASLGLVLGVLFICSVVQWLARAGRDCGVGAQVNGVKNVNGLKDDDRIMSVTVNLPWMNGTWTAEPVLERSSRT
jgi:hypothetical protein